MSLDDQGNEVWELAVRLNDLRNEIWHSLHSLKRAAKTQAVVDLYFRLAREIPNGLRGQAEHIVLGIAIYFFLGFLSSFQTEVHRFRRAPGFPGSDGVVRGGPRCGIAG